MEAVNTVQSVAQRSEWQGSICLFAGSAMGKSDEFPKVTEQLATTLAAKSVPVVYGGGTAGLMGLTALTILRSENTQARVHGIIPGGLDKYERPETKHFSNSTDLPEDFKNPVLSQEDPSKRNIITLVDSMHTRKRCMSLATHRGFIALPGGYGTLEEVAEMITWTQLSLHCLPVVLINVHGFFSPLKNFIDNAVSSGFIPSKNVQFCILIDEPKSQHAQAHFDWGTAALDAIDFWHRNKGNMEPFRIQWNMQAGDS